MDRRRGAPATRRRAHHAHPPSLTSALYALYPTAPSGASLASPRPTPAARAAPPTDPPPLSSQGLRPTLPYKAAFGVCRGSFLYLFVARSHRLPTERALDVIPLYGARFRVALSYHHEDLPEQTNLLFVHLSIPWHERKNFYLKLNSPAEVHAWHEDLTRRAKKVPSSADEFRVSIRKSATLTDPTLKISRREKKKAAAPPQLVRGDGSRTSGTRENVPPLGEGSRARRRVKTRAAAGDSPSAAVPLAPSGSGGGGSCGSKKKSKEELAKEKRAAAIFGSVVMYTPRGISGTADDDVYPPQYEVRENKYPGLAASARAAREANEQAILDEERARKKAQQEARDFVAREMAEYAGLTADDLEAELRI